MKKLRLVLSFVLGIVFFIASGAFAAGVPSICQPTGFFRDGINLTAALVNPPGTVTGLVDATTCNIGVYFDGGNNARLVGADIFGANYYGVVVNTDNGSTSHVSIRLSNVHHIGEVPHNGAQHGRAIYLNGFAGRINGVIDNNWVFDYQKGGIAAYGSGINVDITNNVVTGDGHVAFIAQNGILMLYGASNNLIADNYVYGNSYVGTPGDGSSSVGILVLGGAGAGTCPPAGLDCAYTRTLQIRGNRLVANDVGIDLLNADASGDPPATRTNILVSENVVYGDLCYNQSYQAGISDVGNRDRLVNNTVYGPGYTACATGTDIDVTDAANPVVRNRPRRSPPLHGAPE